MTKFFGLAVLAASLVPATAFGATISLADASVGAVMNGKTSHTVTDSSTGVDVTFQAVGGRLSYQAGDGIGINAGSGENNWSWSGDGGDDWAYMGDEIDQNERLLVSFSEDVMIESIAITDLYDEGWIPMVYFYAPDEEGRWVVTDSEGNSYTDKFYGTEDRYVSNGNYTIDLGGLLGKTLSLFSTNLQNGQPSPFKGFSVASISFSTKGVPELGAQGLGASAFLLFGAGLLLNDRRRRQLSIEHA